MEVALIQWPAEASRRADLQDRHAPRLLLVEPGCSPPEPTDCLEDWIRVPATDVDVQTRMTTLSARAREHTVTMPLLDDDGVLRFGAQWVALPPLEAKLTHALLERFGRVARREDLTRAAWPDVPPARNVLDVHVLRLRRRVTDVGLAIRTVRSRGYVMEPAGEG